MDHKLLLKVTAGNLRNSHLSIAGHHDFFPRDAIGPAKRNGNGHHGIDLVLDGLNQTITTDIPRDGKSGRPRNILRERHWIGQFYKHHGVIEGSEVELERLAERRYRLSIPAAKGNRPDATGVSPVTSACDATSGQKPRAAEFFAGIGLVRLALENQGWEVVFANDIDEDKATMYRHNWPATAGEGANHLVVGDIHDLKASDIPDCELFTASFPCNDLSIAGRWEGLSGKESSAFWGLIALLDDLKSRRPPLILLENVVGFLQRNGGSDFEQALAA